MRAVRQRRAGWGWVTRALHWTMAALILFQLGFGLYMVQAVPDLLARFTLTQTHKSWGFVVFVLAVDPRRLAARQPLAPGAAGGDAALAGAGRRGEPRRCSMS